MPGPSTTASLRRNTSEVLDAISRVLEPYIGRLMAKTAPRAHCGDLGIHAMLIEGAQIDALLDKLGLALVIFLGKEKSEIVVQDMRKAILGLGDVK